MNGLAIQDTPVTYFLLLVNILFSISGFQNYQIFNQYKFDIFSIVKYKDYKRMITSGFLHANWMHLFFNMYVLYIFGRSVEYAYGTLAFSVIYGGSLIAGSLVSYFINRHNTSYTAVGASGAVSGVVFAYIAADPTAQLGLLFIPFYIDGWIFGLAYLFYSTYSMRNRRDNIGHEAHLGGSIAGMLIAVAFYPHLLFENYQIMLLTFAIVIIAFYGRKYIH